MAIIKKYNKANNTTYVYDSVSYWDKELKQPRSKRKLIGKIDPVTGEIVPTGKRGKKPAKENDAHEGPTAASPDGSSEKPISDGTDRTLVYTDLERQLLETQAALAKAESTVAQLTTERQEAVKLLEQLLRLLNH